MIIITPHLRKWLASTKRPDDSWRATISAESILAELAEAGVMAKLGPYSYGFTDAGRRAVGDLPEARQ